MKRMLTLLFTLMLALALCGCNEETVPQESADTGIHVTDMAGETVILQEIPRRILAQRSSQYRCCNTCALFASLPFAVFQKC